MDQFRKVGSAVSKALLTKVAVAIFKKKTCFTILRARHTSGISWDFVLIRFLVYVALARSECFKKRLEILKRFRWSRFLLRCKAVVTKVLLKRSPSSLFVSRFSLLQNGSNYFQSRGHVDIPPLHNDENNARVSCWICFAVMTRMITMEEAHVYVPTKVMQINLKTTTS
jgi:hypothetical protein